MGLNSLVMAADTEIAQVSATPILCNSFSIQQVSGNTGALYIGLAEMDPSTLEGVLRVLPAPSSTSLPAYSVGVSGPPNALNLMELWVASSADGDEALVSYLVV
jgi:hypothetical protein